MSSACVCECCDHMPDTTAFLKSFTDGTFTISPPEWFAPLMVGCFKQTLDATDAPNYLEMRVGDEEGNVYPLVLHRPGGSSPHQLRETAEAERDRLAQLLLQVHGAVQTEQAYEDWWRDVVDELVAQGIAVPKEWGRESDGAE